MRTITIGRSSQCDIILSNNNISRVEEHYSVDNDKLTIGWGILAFLIPVVSWIMYFAWKDETSNRANAAGMICIISFILGAISFLS